MADTRARSQRVGPALHNHRPAGREPEDRQSSAGRRRTISGGWLALKLPDLNTVSRAGSARVPVQTARPDRGRHSSGRRQTKWCGQRAWGGERPEGQASGIAPSQNNAVDHRLPGQRTQWFLPPTWTPGSPARAFLVFAQPRSGTFARHLSSRCLSVVPTGFYSPRPARRRGVFRFRLRAPLRPPASELSCAPAE